MRDVAIVPAQTADLPAIRSLVQAYHTSEDMPDPPDMDGAILTLMADHHPGGFWLACRHGETLGYICVTPRYSLAAGGDILVIDELYVHEAARGQGLGRQLIDAVQAYGESIGCRLLLLEVSNHNRTATHFYAALGFTPRLRRCWERPIAATTAARTTSLSN
jgi:ribosomal protein S18 acetylase RimI-like enzyme